MKKIIILLFTLAITCRVVATEQQPDVLLYNNLTLSLNTGWGHPSPLQTYFYQKKIAYPFKMLSTANYRGHIATWVIQNDRFYLKEIDVKSKISLPEKYGIKNDRDASDSSSLVFADWFSGLLECDKPDSKDRWKTVSTFYVQIRHGKVVAISEVTKKDFERIRKISFKDTVDRDLMTKYKLLFLNQNYIAYYYRLNENDIISFNNRNGKLNTGVERLSPVYGVFNNEHLDWPYNWENVEKCGAPNCNWKIVNDSLLLTKLQLYSGTRFDSIDKEDLPLNLLFPGKVDNSQVFADWVTGVQLIVFGIDTSYGLGYNEFKPKEYIYCRFEKGILKESYSIPAGYDMENNKDRLAPRLKELMKEYRLSE
jgi:hypothetical protein